MPMLQKNVLLFLQRTTKWAGFCFSLDTPPLRTTAAAAVDKRPGFFGTTTKPTRLLPPEDETSNKCVDDILISFSFQENHSHPQKYIGRAPPKIIYIAQVIF